MSYSAFLMISNVIIALFVPIIAFIAFKRGYELGVKDWNLAHPEEPKTLPDRKPRTASPETDKELKKYATLFENIENYDGTDAHQQEIK